jgi:hypothetical protein
MVLTRVMLARGLALCALAASAWINVVSCSPKSDDEAPAEAGSSDAPAPNVDAGADGDAAFPDAPAGMLVEGLISVAFFDTAGDIAYVRADITPDTVFLEVISSDGGTPIRLSTSKDWGFFPEPGTPVYGRAMRDASALVFFTGSQKNGTGTINVWTRAHGVMTLGNAYRDSPNGTLFGLAQTGSNFYFASPSDGGIVDGSVVSVDVTLTTLDDLTRSATVRNVDIAAGSNCPPVPKLSDDGKRLVLTYCAGADPTAQLARVVVLEDSDAGIDASTLVSDTPPTSALVPQLAISTDLAATQLFGIGLASLSPVTIQGRVIDVGTGKVNVLDPNVRDGFVSPDGGTVVYLVGDSMRRAAHDGGAKTTLVASGYGQTLAKSDDGRLVAFSPLDGGLSIASTLVPNQTPTFVTSDQAFAVTFSPDGTELAYSAFSDAGWITPYVVSTDGGATRAVPFNGDFAILGPMASKGRLLILENERQRGPLQVFDLWLFDPKTNTSTMLAEGVNNALINAALDRIAYATGGAEAGLFVRSLP